MANIRIVNIEVTGSALFLDNESYLNDLTAAETSTIAGGMSPTAVIIATYISPIILPMPRPLPPIFVEV
jgi:hypothetical protein